jgi:alanyl-tRNA synthetase
LRSISARDKNSVRDGDDEMSGFTAVVTDIREESRIAGRHRWQIALDHTDFSPGTTGELQAVARSGARLVVPVLDTIVDLTGQVWHVVEKPLAAGTTVTGHMRLE